jgi:hypothetical protein
LLPPPLNLNPSHSSLPGLGELSGLSIHAPFPPQLLDITRVICVELFIYILLYIVIYCYILLYIVIYYYILLYIIIYYYIY